MAIIMAIGSKCNIALLNIFKQAEALEQALYPRRPERDSRLIHPGDRGAQSVSIRYSERLAQAGVEPSAGSKQGYWE